MGRRLSYQQWCRLVNARLCPLQNRVTTTASGQVFRSTRSIIFKELNDRMYPMTNDYPRFIKYVPGWKCVKCEALLSYHEMMHSHGMCPKCGHDSNSTVCDVQVIRWAKYQMRPDWHFWKGLKFEYRLEAREAPVT